MPLPESVPREALHTRSIRMQGFRRADGLFDIEASLVDTKPFQLSVHGAREVPPGEAIHDMAIRVVVNDMLEVMDVVAVIDAAPHRTCPQATQTVACLKGLRIGSGWTRAVRERLSGAAGCTHLMELLLPMATVAFQALLPVRLERPTPVDAQGRPTKIDSCYAYARQREVVQRLWPAYFDDSGSRP